MKLATTLTILAIAFIVTVILAPISIPLLRRLKFGQSIREE
ncbi:Phospho-N-acetylmuramoyl-pentapeptide-transferaseOS=Lysinibacillus sphaericus OX=1421 GN=mraY PE=3 SV=1 [Lysinibacillus sphaericus]